MKHLLVAAVLVLASSPLRAAPSGADSDANAAALDVAGRGELLQELETWRAMHLARTAEKVSRVYGPRLKAIKNRVAAAAEAKDLVEPKKDFEAWKTALLREQYAEARAAGMTGGADFAAYRQEQSLSAAMMSSIRAQVQQAAFNGPRAFDGSSSAGGLGAVAVASSDPARYGKIRQIMISQGAKPRIVDAAIKEALRQGVDPTLVLSVIWQEWRVRPAPSARAA